MQRELKADLYLFLCTVIWGATYIVIKFGLVDASPLFFVSVRFLLAGILFLPLVNMTIERGAWKYSLRAGLILGLLVFLGYGLQTVGLKFTTASRSGFLTYLLVFFTVPFQYWLLKRPPSTGNYLGAFLIFPGLFFMISPVGGGLNIGDFLTIFAACAFGLYVVLIHIYAHLHNVVLLTFYQMFFAGLFSLGFALAIEEVYLQPTYSLLGSLLFLATIATVLTVFLQTRYQKETTPVRAALLFSLEPVWAAIFAYFLLEERMLAFALAGGIMIVLGVLLSEIWSFLMKRVYETSSQEIAGQKNPK